METKNGWYQNSIYKHLFAKFVDNKITIIFHNRNPPGTKRTPLYGPNQIEQTWIYPDFNFLDKEIKLLKFKDDCFTTDSTCPTSVSITGEKYYSGCYFTPEGFSSSEFDILIISKENVSIKEQEEKMSY